MAKQPNALISIMPSIHGQKAHKYFHSAVMSTDLPSEAMGEAVTECINKMWADGLDPVNDMVSLEIKFA